MHLSELTAMLARTPATLDALLTDLPTEWVHRNDGPGTLSAYDIVGHLTHADITDHMPRTRMILELGPDRPFEPFDREGQVGEVLARQYRNAVGPWRAYLPTLDQVVEAE